MNELEKQIKTFQSPAAIQCQVATNSFPSISLYSHNQSSAACCLECQQLVGTPFRKELEFKNFIKIYNYRNLNT